MRKLITIDVSRSEGARRRPRPAGAWTRAQGHAREGLAIHVAPFWGIGEIAARAGVLHRPARPMPSRSISSTMRAERFYPILSRR